MADDDKTLDIEDGSPEPGVPEVDISGGTAPDATNDPDVRDEPAEADEPPDFNSTSARDGIVIEARSDRDDAQEKTPAQPRAHSHATAPKQSRDRAAEKLMAGVISRIERLENWVKTNRFG